MQIAALQPFHQLLPGWWLAAYLGAIAALPLLLLAFLALRRRGRKRRFHGWLPAEPAQIPREFARLGQPWIGRLAFLGFPVVRIMRSPDGADPESIHWLVASAKDRTAGVFTGSMPSGGGKTTFSLRLVTFLGDGRVQVTADRLLTRRPPAHWGLVQRRFETLESQVLEHRNRLAAEANGTQAILPQAHELPSQLAMEARAAFDALKTSGDYVECGEDTLRPALSRLPRLALQDFAALFTGNALPSGRRKDVASAARDTTPGEEDIAPIGASMTLSPEQLVERDLLRYRKHADQPPGLKHRWLRLLVLVGTVAVFTVAFGHDNRAATAFMLLGIISVHEFGHWLTMKIFGYRGMGRFFIPFLGPVDRGRKLHATPWQQMLVILAGPVPGLLAGLALLIAGYFLPGLPAWLLDVAGLSVVLNAFHLLPFLPLDGGKIVDLLVFRDLPLLRPLFTFCSGAATLLAALAAGSRAVMAIALAMFAGLVWDIKMIKVVRGGRRLGWAGSINDEDEALRRIFRGVRDEENEAFLRSSDWQRQIDVLLAEVLRKRPGFLTRIFGGWIYGSLCLLPIAAVAGVVVLVLVNSLAILGRQSLDTAEFQEAFPRETRAITEVQHGAVESLAAATRTITTDGPVDAANRTVLAARALPVIGAQLDKLDWLAAGIVHRADLIEPELLSLWLEIQCGRLEAATRGGRWPEAIRRAESLLYGIGAMEPALTLGHRKWLRDAELRTLAEVEKISAAGALNPVLLQRIESRVNALNKAPLPEVENLLLVGGWGTAQMEGMLPLSGETGDIETGDGSLPDLRFWRHAYPHLKRLAESRPWSGGTPATVALARHWKQSRRVGELPPTLDKAVSTTKEEAEFIFAFCEELQLIQWRRMTTLSALRLESYRQKSGNFPERWKHRLPGGAELELILENGPMLELSDHRSQIQSGTPAWLAAAGPPEPVRHRCSLFGTR